MFEAVIFDMDGLLIDSEPFWRTAEKEVFGSLGVDVTAELALQTSRMTTKEVTEYWYRLKPWEHKSLPEVEQAVIQQVGQLIERDGVIMPGVITTLLFFKRTGYKIGLATNAPDILVSKVLRKLNIEHYFNTTVSSDAVDKGKPSPDVYLKTALMLNVSPVNCIAFEDSASGIQAAIAAGMKVIAVPDKSEFDDIGFETADIKISSLNDFCEAHLQFLNRKSVKIIS